MKNIATFRDVIKKLQRNRVVSRSIVYLNISHIFPNNNKIYDISNLISRKLMSDEASID